MIHFFIEGTLTALLAAACIVRYRIFRLWRSGATLNCDLQARNCDLQSRLEKMTVRRRRGVIASRRRQKRASLGVRLLQERHRGAIDALTAQHEEIVASVEAKRQRAIDEAAPLVGEVYGLRDIVKFHEGEREKFKAGLLRFGKQLDVAKASTDLIKVGLQMKDWVKSFIPVPDNFLPAPAKKLSANS